MFTVKQKIFWLLILFFLPIFSFAESISPLCISSIDNQFEKLQDKKMILDSQVYENKDFSQEKKSEIISYNYRNFQCSVEALCLSLQSYIFQKWKNDLIKPEHSIIWCWNNYIKDINFNNFNPCLTDVSDVIKNLAEVTEKCSDRMWEVVANERSRMIWEFEIYSMQNKSYFLSAKILSINTKMRGLSVQMSKLRTLLEKVIDKVTCRQT